MTLQAFGYNEMHFHPEYWTYNISMSSSKNTIVVFIAVIIINIVLHSVFFYDVTSLTNTF